MSVDYTNFDEKAQEQVIIALIIYLNDSHDHFNPICFMLAQVKKVFANLNGGLAVLVNNVGMSYKCPKNFSECTVCMDWNIGSGLHFEQPVLCFQQTHCTDSNIQKNVCKCTAKYSGAMTAAAVAAGKGDTHFFGVGSFGGDGTNMVSLEGIHVFLKFK